jgi:uncharacterized protein
VTSPPYLDTSALAKWFFVEPRSLDFEAFIQESGKGAISSLCRLEFRSLAYRRLRSGEIDESYVSDALALLDSLADKTVLVVHPLREPQFDQAEGLLTRFGAELGLRTLDALHLAAALASRASVFATADRRLAVSAARVGLRVVRFD